MASSRQVPSGVIPALFRLAGTATGFAVGSSARVLSRVRNTVRPRRGAASKAEEPLSSTVDAEKPNEEAQPPARPVDVVYPWPDSTL